MKHFFFAVILLLSVTAQAQPTQWNWVQPVEGSNPLEDIATDPFGNLYVTGTFTGFLQLGSTQLSNPGFCLYVAKFSPAGQLLFATKLQASNTAFAASIAVDKLGNSYVTGVFNGTLSLGDQTLASSHTTVGSNGDDIMTLKLAPNGAVRWLQQISSVRAGEEWEPSNLSRAIAVDAAGNSYISGSVSGSTVQFGGRTFSDREGQAFIASYTPQGALRWANVATSPDATTRSDGVHLAVNDQGTGYVSGGFYGGSLMLGGARVPASSFSDDFLAQFDLSLGRVNWAQNPEGTDGPLAVDRKGHLYRAGQFTGTVAFGKSTLRSTGTADIFVARYNSQGKAEWATAILGEGPYNYPEDMVVDTQNGRIYLTGTRSITSDFQAFIAFLQANGKVKHIESVGVAGTTTSSSSGFSIALAGHNSVYNSGIFTGTAQFGPFTLTSPFTQYYLASYGSKKTVRSGSQGMLAALTASLYPMPAHEQFTLRLESREKNQVLRAVLYNQLGVPVAEKTIQNPNGKLEAVFDTSQLPRGLYVLRLQQNGQLLIKTVTVE